ncbi:MAG: TMEM175 family protein [Ignavibacteria bacterium]|nr:TMEM175 family protein [Ignavibacteria bacterium]
MNNKEGQQAEYTPKTTRIEAFSDGVFAIVVTLLVLEIKVPHFESGATNTEMIRELLHLLPKFIGFVLSFVIVAIFWVNHHQLFHSLERSDRKLLWLNNLLLLWMSFIPFPTALLGEYPLQPVSVFVYGAVLLLASVSFNLMLRHAVKSGLFDESISKEVLSKSIRRGMIGPLVYLASVLGAFVSVYISLALFVLVPVYYFVPQKIVKQEVSD